MRKMYKVLRCALPVHDISTDYDECPQFIKGPGKEAQPRMVETCKSWYSDVQPLRVPGADVSRVLELVNEAASGMPNWTLLEESKEQGVVQYLAVTPTMKFKVRGDMHA